MMPSRDEIFLDVREIDDPAQRSAYIAKACGTNVALRAEVEAMLVEAGQADSFFGRDDTSDSPASPLGESAGTIIGRYKLLKKIGEGGMGVVYMAEQREPVVRKVALKIIKVGMDTRQVIARFEAERQALALMDHPNIAKVLDGGETETGRPYFVMDLVEGLPISKFCDKEKLSTRERLDLFLDVCSGIQHAHLKGIIHRDIKPSNILVTLHADKAVPKVIDFGIAKATEQPLTNKTLFTQFQHFLGTPAYMSPEQASLRGLDIDTRSDIYGLGVLLYELLTGTTPFDGKELLKAGLDEMRRTICEKEAMRPSHKLTTLQAEELDTTARRHGTEWFKLVGAVRGDLDWIVMKCLEKDRARRYETATALVADIQRHLGSEPIAARPPSAVYRFEKAIRRNRLAFSAAAIVGFALLTAAAVSSWQVVRANRERARAERSLRATLKFVENVFTGVSQKLQSVVGGAEASADLNAKGFLLMEELQRDADGNPQFALALGKIYTQMALSGGSIGVNTSANYEVALNAATQAIRLFLQLETKVPEDVRASRIARAQMAAGFAAKGLQRHEEALAHFREMDRWARLMAAGSNSIIVAEGAQLQRWAGGCMGEEIEALGQSEKALREHYLPFLQELQSRNVSEQSKNWLDLHDLAAASQSLGRVYTKVGQFDKAEHYLRQWHRVLGLSRNQRPNDAQKAAEHPLAAAELGRFLLSRGSVEGLEHLEAATNAIQHLIAQDWANVTFAENRIRIVKLCALAFAEWSADGSVLLADREKRVDDAQRELERAEALLTGLPSQSLRKALQAELEEARRNVAAAKSKLAEPSQTPERPQ